MKNTFTFTAVVYPYPGMAAWRFVNLPRSAAEAIRSNYGSRKKGWGSIPVRVTAGTTTWETSIFPDQKSQTYLLPMKREIRMKEKMLDGKKITLSLRIRL
jgi:hypothetical protein